MPHLSGNAGRKSRTANPALVLVKCARKTGYLGVALLFAFLIGGANTATAGGTARQFCGMGHDVRTGISVTDHSSSDNPPVGFIRLLKNCTGPVVGRFTAHLSGSLHLHELEALCLGNGGFSGGCTRGQLLVADPSHTFLQSNGEVQVSRPIETAMWVWPQLLPGSWQFRVRPAAFAPVTIDKSIFTVEAYAN